MSRRIFIATTDHRDGIIVGELMVLVADGMPWKEGHTAQHPVKLDLGGRHQYAIIAIPLIMW